MAFSVTDIRTNLDFAGARPTLFEVQLVIPAGIPQFAGREIRFMAQAASLPASNIGVIATSYFGRDIKNPGDRTFDPWQVSIINDEDFIVRDALEAWHNVINARRRNVRQTSTSAPSWVKTQAIVRQYGRTGEEDVLREYLFQGVWPSNLSDITLNWGAKDQIEEFGAVFQYDWYDPEGKTVQGINVES